MLHVSETSEKLHQQIWKVFTKKHGLTLQSEAFEYLKERVDVHGELSQEELTNALDYIANEYKRTAGYKTLVDATTLVKVIERMVRNSNALLEKETVLARKYFLAISAEDCVLWTYDAEHGKFQAVNDGKMMESSVVGKAGSKPRMFKNQYELGKLRILHSSDFGGTKSAKVI